MKQALRTPQLLAALLVAGALLGGCATAEKTSPSASLQQQVQSAHTKAEHQNLAAYYDKEAGMAHAAAETHRKMGMTYGPAPLGRSGLNMQEHCNALGTKYDGIATDYEGLAAYHRQLAERAPQ